MFSLNEQVRKNFADKQLSQAIILQIALNAIHNFFNKKIRVEGYLKYGVLFIKTPERINITTIFIHKKTLIDTINAKIQKI
jgi:hypothetical protein